MNTANKIIIGLIVALVCLGVIGFAVFEIWAQKNGTGGSLTGSFFGGGGNNTGSSGGQSTGNTSGGNITTGTSGTSGGNTSTGGNGVSTIPGSGGSTGNSSTGTNTGGSYTGTTFNPGSGSIGSTTQNGGGSSTGTPGSGVVVTTDANGTTAQSKDIKKDPALIADPVNNGIYYLGGDSAAAAKANKPYIIEYIASTQYFNVVLTQEPIGQARIAAQTYLADHLGFTQAQLCGLNYTVSVPYSVNKDFAGIDLGFNGCADATAF